MRNILITVSYDGTYFCGWQRQDKSDGGKPVRTVQGEIEKVLETIHKVKTPLQGSGRTDSGVHAVRQAANFFSPVDSIPVKKSATSRSYRYFIIPSHKALASQMPYAWDIGHEPDIDKLNEMASCLKGEIDCATFAASGDESLSTFRFINDAHFFYQDLYPWGKALVFEITANAFLWKMVRSIVGSLIFFEKDKDVSYFKEVLESHDRSKAGPTAPPQGLFLWDVSFEGERKHI